MTVPSPAASHLRVVQATRASRLAAIAGIVLLAVLASLPAWGDAGTMRLLIDFLTLLALAEMWNLLAGYAGLVSIGQQAFIGLGAYGLYIFADLLGLNPLLSIAISAVGVGLIALATSFFVFRLEGGYFAVGTWVIAEVFRLIVASDRAVGAGTGVSIQSLAQFGPQGRITITYWLALAVGFGAVVAGALIMRSRLGLSLRGIRDSDIAARSLGVDVFRAKVAVYLIASVGCAVAGSVIYMNLLRIQPTAAFGVEWTARVIFIVIIGGLGSIEGPIIGTVLFIALRELLGDFGSAYLIILGLTAVVVTIVAPRGLWGVLEGRYSISLFGIQRRLLAEPTMLPGDAPGDPPGPGPNEGAS
jgi:branched-chain amino acid transport system permease protein